MDHQLCDDIRRQCVDSFAYLATPFTRFSRGIIAAHDEACKVTAALLLHGVPCYSPIAHSFPIAITGQIDPLDHTFWMAACKPFMRAAACLIVVKLDGWDQSAGIRLEMDAFDRAGKPIWYLDWESSTGEK